MKKYLSILLLLSFTSSCAYKDMSRNLRYADNRPVGVENIKFKDLQKMKKGKSCSYNLLYVIPIYGNSSIITAAEDGEINNVQLIGETGFWTFPFSKTCTMVYGD